MELYTKIITIYPELTEDDFKPGSGCISLSDYRDGKGPVIAVWNYIKPKPTQDELDSIE